jgi:transcription elongation GreA/GreB family factor
MSDDDNGKTEAGGLRRLAAKKRFDDLEAAWTEAVEGDAVDTPGLLSVLERVQRAGEDERAESLLWFLLSDRAERKGAAEALRVARAALDLFPGSAVLREEMAGLIPAAHADVPEAAALVEQTLGRDDLPLSNAVGRLERLLALRPGTYVLDPEGERAGRVRGFDPSEGVTVAFGETARTYAVDAVDGLEPLPEDDFRALLAYDPARLETLAAEDPAGLVTRTLRAYGPRLTLRQLRSHLAGVVPKAAWSRWWSAARPKLRRAAWVDVSEGASPTFTLRSRALPYDAVLKAQFNRARTPEDKLAAVLDYLKEIEQGASPDAAVLQFFAARLDEMVGEFEGREPVWAVGALAARTAVHRALPDAVPAPEREVGPLLPSAEALPDLMRPVTDRDLSVWMLRLVRQGLPERWRDVCLAVMPGCTQAGCDWIAQALIGSGEGAALASAVDETVARPDRNARALAWLWKTGAGGSAPEALRSVDLGAVAVALFSAAASLSRGRRDQAEQQRLLPEVRSAVSYRNYEPLRQVLEGAGEGRARQIKAYVERHTGLSDLACRRVHEVLRKTHPGLFVQARVPAWEENAVYTTEAGLAKQQERLGHLVHVKLAEASQAVGAAAARGDLSENAEWTAAKEERDRLAARIGRLQEELGKAKLITREMTGAERVTVGTAVRAKNVDSGEVERLVFLGPWDADPDRGVYSYRTALGRAFMGKAVGERVTFDADGRARTWEVLEVQPGV